MRTRTVAAITLMLALATAGCARGGTDDPAVASAPGAGGNAAAASAGPGADDPDAQLKFSRCMREQGLSWFPDPSDGKLAIKPPPGTDDKKIQAAQEKCKQFLPNGGEPPKLSAEELEKVRLYAKCMRENGLPNFPDPGPKGELDIDVAKVGSGPDDPSWQKAEASCKQFDGPRQISVRRQDGGR